MSAIESAAYLISGLCHEGSQKSAFNKPANDGLMFVMMRCLSWQKQCMSFLEIAPNPKINTSGGKAKLRH
jgi:hypothetical protein